MMHKARTKALSWLLGLALILSFVPTLGTTAQAEESVTYREASVNEQKQVTYTIKTRSDYTAVAPGTTTWNEGWYVVNSDVTISDPITFSGAVHLILADDATLTVKNCIKCENYNGTDSLTIYGQTAGTGKLTITGDDDPGIGGWGTVAIHGGTVTAMSKSREGISVGNGTVAIYGGTVTAVGKEASAGIAAIFEGKVAIYGGTVNATGGKYAAGIDAKTIEISGGTVTATGDFYAAISAGYGGTVTISGGTVNATGNGDCRGIGGSGTVNISGGAVNATGGKLRAGIEGDTVNISGGTVTAIGGGTQTDNIEDGGAGIEIYSGTLTISGGTVTATGGEQCAGIGASGGTVTISNGTVTATGGMYGAGIGGGASLDGGTVTITGGSVTAIGGADAAGIGGGFNNDGDGAVTLGTGVTVRAGANETGAVEVNADSFAASHTQKWVRTVADIPATDITLNETFSLYVGDSQRLPFTVTPFNATDLAWTSSNSSVATVDANGIVTGVAVGTTTISVNSAKYNTPFTCYVTVNPVPVESVFLNKTTIALFEGSAETLTATVSPENATNKSVTWRSSDTAVATVDVNGVVTAVGGGSAIITATTSDGNKTASCTVTVTPSVAYLAWDDNSKQLQSAALMEDYASVADSATTWDAGWYVVDSSVTIAERVTVNGAVKLILTDGKTLTVSKGITVTGENSLTVYGQSAGTGTLYAGTTNGTDKTCANQSAGIGTGENGTGGTVTIHGGTVIARGGDNYYGGAGIGGGDSGDGGKITVYGGTVNATGGEYGAGIGGGMNKDGGTITVYGGAVTATGGRNGAGIGGGNRGAGGTIAIYGGDITANGGERSGAGVGGGDGADGGFITIYGGTVTANGGGYTAGAGIGGGYKGSGGTITIHGGTVTATGGTATESYSYGSGAGIGGGGGSDATGSEWDWPGDSGTITIDGGTVTASGGKNSKGSGAAIGSGGDTNGVKKDSGTLTLNGVVVQAGADSDSAEFVDADVFGADYKFNTYAYAQTTVPVHTESVTLNDTSVELNKGGTVALTATILPANATYRPASWSSSNEAVATVDQSGLVTAVGGGTATITASSDGQTATCAVTVNVPLTGVSLNKASAALNKGDTERLTVSFDPADATNQSVTWESSNTSVATVDGSGLVTAVGGGSATITVTAAEGGKTATCAVTVTVPVSGVTLNQTQLTLPEYNTEQLTVAVAPDDATNKNVAWTSSNTTVVTVDASGVVTAVAPGTATITASSGGKIATCAVTVTRAVSAYTVTVPETLTIQNAGVNSFTMSVAGMLIHKDDVRQDWIRVEAQPVDSWVLTRVGSSERITYESTNEGGNLSKFIWQFNSLPAEQTIYLNVEDYSNRRAGTYTGAITFTVETYESMGGEPVDSFSFTRTVLLTIPPDPTVSYLDGDGTLRFLSDVRYNTVGSSSTSWSGDIRGGWYVVKGDVTIPDRVTVDGDVKLILCDGATLTAEKGIEFKDGADDSLTVYGQYAGTGKMVATGDGNNAGINGKDGTAYDPGGKVNIYGGTVVTVGGGSGKGVVGTLTVTGTLAVYGDDNDANPTTWQSNYSSTRWKYMTVKPAPLTSGPYINETGTETNCPAYTAIGSNTTAWSDGWYAAISDVTIDQAVTVTGMVNLILNDGVTLTVNGGITGGTLNVYAQQRGSGMLTVNNASGAGIGSNLNLYGGSVAATGGANGAGVNGAVTVAAGSLTAIGGASGDGITGGSLTVNDGVVTATSANGAGISSMTLTVKDGTVTATGKEKGISGAISITGADRMVQGGASSASIAPIQSPYTERTPYMIVGESVYTIFYKVENGWTIPFCAYNGNAAQEMEQDGEYWRLTVHEKPSYLTFSGGTPSASTEQQTVDTISTVSSGGLSAGTQIANYGTFYVVSGGCRMVTFVSVGADGNSIVNCVPVADGALVACPIDPPQRDGFLFLGWGQYNFSSPVKSSMTIYARYYQESYYVDFWDAHGGWYGGSSYNASVQAQFADQRIAHGGTARNPGTPPKPEAGSVFQGWVLMDTIQYTDGSGDTVTLPAGTKFDFNTPITCKVRLKASWLHVHQYGNSVEAFAAYMIRTKGSYNNNDAYQLRMNNTGHYKVCTICGQATMEPHTLDSGNHCTVCGVTVDNSAIYTVSYEARDLTKTVSLGSKTFKAGNTSGFPWYQAEDGALFQSYLVYDENGTLIRTETNPNNKLFTVDRNLKIVATYRNRFEVYAKSTVGIKTSAVNNNTASLELSWSLPAGYGFTSAGILTTTNKELNKYNYSFLTRQQTLDTGNLLKEKNKQSVDLYASGLRQELQSYMLSGTSYDPNQASTIHSFPVKSAARTGSYQVPHELPIGDKAATYGPWVYVIGYLTYTDTQGVSHTIYTEPVAVSSTDSLHSTEYTYNA